MIAVCGFVLIGRASHHESDALAGFLATVWPFLAGLLVGWLVSRAWTRPQQPWPAGVICWIVTVVVGLGLRGLTGGGLAWTFLIVTAVVLAVFLIGWRVVVGWVRARRSTG